jgi:hypothetical protein
MVSPRARQIREAWGRDNLEMHNAPARARKLSSQIYPGLTDPSTQQLVRTNWQKERQKPSKRFKRRPFRRRGIRGDENEP